MRLQRNLAINGPGFVACERLALTDRRGGAHFYPAVDGNEGAGTLGARPDERRRGGDLLALVEVHFARTRGWRGCVMTRTGPPSRGRRRRAESGAQHAG